jgi:hypothetical protein
MSSKLSLFQAPRVYLIMATVLGIVSNCVTTMGFMSVIPYSPEMNLTPTLAALALRHSELLPRFPEISRAADAPFVIN